MADRNGQVLLGAYVPAELADRFKNWARTVEGSASAALRRLVAGAVDGRAPSPPPGAAGFSVMVRLKDAERIALLDAAEARSTTPANWLRSLAITHLGRRPQWTPSEITALREVFNALSRIGNNVNQMAYVMNTAALTGEYPASQGDAALEAAELVRLEMRRVVAVMSGNFDYWGLPNADRPASAPDALRQDRLAKEKERARQRLRPRCRPARFKAGAGPG